MRPETIENYLKTIYNLSSDNSVLVANKELADKLFAELNTAHERNDLQKVREILENLEKGNFFVHKSDAINEKQLLKTDMST